MIRTSTNSKYPLPPSGQMLYINWEFSILGVMHAYWTSFVITGDPNKIKGKYMWRPKWEKYTVDDRGQGELLYIGEKNGEITHMKEDGFEGAGDVAHMKKEDWAVYESKFWWKMMEGQLEQRAFSMR